MSISASPVQPQKTSAPDPSTHPSAIHFPIILFVQPGATFGLRHPPALSSHLHTAPISGPSFWSICLHNAEPSASAYHSGVVAAAAAAKQTAMIMS